MQPFGDRLRCQDGALHLFAYKSNCDAKNKYVHHRIGVQISSRRSRVYRGQLGLDGGSGAGKANNSTWTPPVAKRSFVVGIEIKIAPVHSDFECETSSLSLMGCAGWCLIRLHALEVPR